jgi:AraC family transcriptional regulator of adaptative response/methylated-DNA-[protein]-cysteine methyltransferase
MKHIENSKQAEKMYELAAFISAHADSALSLSSLAKTAGLSPSHLQRIFKAVIGVSPAQAVQVTAS